MSIATVKPIVQVMAAQGYCSSQGCWQVAKATVKIAVKTAVRTTVQVKAAVKTTVQVKAVVKSIATTVEAGPEVSATTTTAAAAAAATTASAQQQQQLKLVHDLADHDLVL